jgi:hypothetical protein
LQTQTLGVTGIGIDSFQLSHAPCVAPLWWTNWAAPHVSREIVWVGFWATAIAGPIPEPLYFLTSELIRNNQKS